MRWKLTLATNGVEIEEDSTFPPAANRRAGSGSPEQAFGDFFLPSASGFLSRSPSA